MTNEELSKNKTSISQIRVSRFEAGVVTQCDDVVAMEEPLEIRLAFDSETEPGVRQEKSVSITMRTPGQDFELAAGFLFTEGLLTQSDDVVDIRYCGPAQPNLGHSNVVKVEMAPGKKLNLKSLERHFYTSSSCGVCGKASIDALRTANPYQNLNDQKSFSVSRTLISELPERLRTAQKVFDMTGGLHASGLFDLSGELLALREDVGRHNALDKLIGWSLIRKKLPLSESILLLSGRISFELVQKASMAGIRMIAAVGAPSSLALELACENNIALAGFVRGNRFNIYHGEDRFL